MLNLPSFVATFCVPHAMVFHDASNVPDFADPDMYPHTKETDFKAYNGCTTSGMTWTRDAGLVFNI